MLYENKVNELLILKNVNSKVLFLVLYQPKFPYQKIHRFQEFWCNLQNLNYIAISYLVTIDKKIVRVIVGKEGDDCCENGKVPIMYDYTIESSRYSIL